MPQTKERDVTQGQESGIVDGCYRFLKVTISM